MLRIRVEDLAVPSIMWTTLLTVVCVVAHIQPQTLDDACRHGDVQTIATRVISRNIWLRLVRALCHKGSIVLTHVFGPKQDAFHPGIQGLNGTWALLVHIAPTCTAPGVDLIRTVVRSTVLDIPAPTRRAVNWVKLGFHIVAEQRADILALAWIILLPHFLPGAWRNRGPCVARSVAEELARQQGAGVGVRTVDAGIAPWAAAPTTDRHVAPPLVAFRIIPSLALPSIVLPIGALNFRRDRRTATAARVRDGAAQGLQVHCRLRHHDRPGAVLNLESDCDSLLARPDEGDDVRSTDIHGACIIDAEVVLWESRSIWVAACWRGANHLGNINKVPCLVAECHPRQRGQNRKHRHRGAKFVGKTWAGRDVRPYPI